MFLPVPPQSPLPFERVVLPADYRLRNGLGAVGAAAALAQHSASACQWLCPLEQCAPLALLGTPGLPPGAVVKVFKSI
jgi:hypothetical protein